jgi:predicted MarR family transcription regulator
MHLAENEEATSILEVGLCLIHAYQKLKFFLEEAEKISSGIKLNINEIVILHIIRIQKKPKSVTVINLLADFYDDYTIAYTIKKLLKLKLIRKSSSKEDNNGTSYQITEEGISHTDAYVNLRKETLFVAFEEGKSIEEIKALVTEDEESVQKHYKVACKKLNQEKFKQELVSYE